MYAKLYFALDAACLRRQGVTSCNSQPPGPRLLLRLVCLYQARLMSVAHRDVPTAQARSYLLGEGMPRALDVIRTRTFLVSIVLIGTKHLLIEKHHNDD